MQVTLTVLTTQHDCICLSLFKGFMEDYGVMGDSSDLTMWPTTSGKHIVFQDYKM